MTFNPNEQWRNNAGNEPQYAQGGGPVPRMEDMGFVWQPAAMGGGAWIMPQVVRISDADVERIAAAVVRMLKEQTP